MRARLHYPSFHQLDVLQGNGIEYVLFLVAVYHQDVRDCLIVELAFDPVLLVQHVILHFAMEKEFLQIDSGHPVAVLMGFRNSGLVVFDCALIFLQHLLIGVDQQFIIELELELTAVYYS